MADLSRDAPLRFLGDVHTIRMVLDNSAAQTIYKGQPMIIDQSEDTLYPRGFLDATVVASTDVFVGVAAEGAEVETSDTETDNEIEIITYPTIVGFKSSVFTKANLGKTVYMSDSGTLSETAADNPQIGKLYWVEDGYAYVQLTAPQVCAGA
jgi:hypothetical protein